MEGGKLLGALIDPVVAECIEGYSGWTNGGRAGINPRELEADIWG